MQKISERRGSIFTKTVVIFILLLMILPLPVYASDVPEHDSVFIYQNGTVSQGKSGGITRIEHGNVLMEKIIVSDKDGGKAKFKLTIRTSRPDLYWKGMNISISGTDGPLYNDSIESTKGEITFDVPENGALYIGLKPGGDKPSRKGYSMTYIVTADNGTSAERTVKYEPVISHETLFAAAAVLSMIIIFLLILAGRAKKKPGIVLVLAFLALFSALYAAGIRTDIAVNGTMAPDVKKGALVISRENVSESDISKGDIVIYSSDDLTVSGMEKVARKEPGYFYTKTNEKMALENQVKASRIDRKVLFSIPYAGKAIEFITGFIRK